MKRFGIMILGVLLLAGLFALLHQKRLSLPAGPLPEISADLKPDSTVPEKIPSAKTVQLPIQPVLPEEANAPVPFGTQSEDSSVRTVGDLFQPGQQRAFERSLPSEERVKLVKLRSRFFVPGLSADTASAGGEYYLTFTGTPDEQQRKALEEKGVHLIEHITRTTWRAVTEESVLLSGIETLTGAEPVWPADKWSPQLWEQYRNGTDSSGPVEAVVSFTGKTGRKDADALLATAGAEALNTEFEYGQKLRIKSDYAGLMLLCGADRVCSVELPPPPKTLNNLNAAKLANVDDVQAAPYNLTGTNISVMVRDGGEIALHPDFGSRVTIVEAVGYHYHSTHVGGTIAGSGAGSASAKGMAPQAKLYSYDFNGSDAGELMDAKNTYEARLSNHSYGYVIGWEGTTWNSNTNLFGSYTTDTRAWDALVYDEELYIFKAAGNDRNDTGTGHPHDGTWYGDNWYDCMETVSGAKNIITVGAVDSAGVMSDFSNFGPTDDGRIKPDIVADGVAVYSTYSDTTYASMNGTSMATPAACGAAVLLLEQYRALHSNAWPSAAFLKGLMIHTAKDLGRPGPDYAFGWGLIDAKAAVDFILSSASGTLVREENVSESQTNRYTLTLTPAVTNLRVTLCWTDVEGSTAAADALVNDLDVRLISPDSNTVYCPYVMPFAADGSSPTNPAVTGTNQWDNIEQIDVAAPSSGVWTVEVKGALIPSGPQEYAVFFSAGNLDVPQIQCSASEIQLSASTGQTANASMVVSNSGLANLVFTLSDDNGTAGYTWKDSDTSGGPAYSWIDISGSGSAVSLSDDGESSMLNIGFSFSFYGNSYTLFQIGANGGISFSSGDLDYTHVALPSSLVPEQSLLPFWADLDPGSGGSIRYDSSPERLVVSWLTVPLWSTTSYQTFQVVIYPDGRIIYQYNTLAGAYSSSTVGIQSGAQYTQVAYDATYLKNDLAVEFALPKPAWLSYMPSNSILAAGSTTSVWFTGNAAGLSAGVYTATVTVASNDPDAPALAVPVFFTVSEPDTDSDGIPDYWEALYFGGTTNADPNAAAANGINTVSEAYIIGLNPTDAQSVFTPANAVLEGDNLVFDWLSASGRVYTIYWASNLFSAFQPIQSNYTGGVFTDTVHSAANDGFYRIEVRLAP